MGCDSNSQVLWEGGLQRFGQLSGEGALGRRIFRRLATLRPDIPTLLCPLWRRSSLPFGLGGLGRIGSQEAIFERRAVKAANNRLHLVRRRRFYKSEAFRLLRFVVAYHFDRICDKIFRRQPSLDIVGGDPYW
jgi:hypothetical protein